MDEENDNYTLENGEQALEHSGLGDQEVARVNSKRLKVENKDRQQLLEFFQKEAAKTRKNEMRWPSLMVDDDGATVKQLWDQPTKSNLQPFSKNSYRIENSQLICKTNQLTGFCMIRVFTGRYFIHFITSSYICY